MRNGCQGIHSILERILKAAVSYEGMMRGRVLWFDIGKGYGFIKPDEGVDVFVHYSKILAEPGEFRALQENDLVEFEIFEADRGSGVSKPQAKNVRVIGGDDEIFKEQHSTDFRGSGRRPEEGFSQARDSNI